MTEAKRGPYGKPMVWTGEAPAQRFSNMLRDLTLDIGTGNPAATGLAFCANNQGGVTNVRVRAPEGQGWYGIDLGYTGEQGPCLLTGDSGGGI
ncbi:MAG: hypothetical protein HC904_02325 [Blastochloris sp.]|nr:hypothetical protein [Blastochloris sp.]